ncbi:LNS2 (Lipin/Ned1/Smp2) [Phycisphaerae bacterium RAS1]|nr:LNS2 (Lipin/Ned1/Smp2) [Phycisphaerae bacterium RAS1]
MKTRATLLPLAALLLLPVGCGRAVVSVDDAIRIPGQPVRLVAYVEREPMLPVRREIEDQVVRFYLNGAVAEQAVSDGDGRAAISLPEALGCEQFEARATVGGAVYGAVGRIFDWQPDRTIIVVDIDNTVADSDLDEVFFDAAAEASPALPDSATTLTRLSKDYHIMYVTARPRAVLEKTRAWLSFREFPAGPVVTASRLRDAIRDARFKRRVLQSLREEHPNILIGIGDRRGDARAYASNRMLTLIVGRTRDDRFVEQALLLPSWRAVSTFFELNHETLRDPALLRAAFRGERNLVMPVSVYWPDERE